MLKQLLKKIVPLKYNFLKKNYKQLENLSIKKYEETLKDNLIIYIYETIEYEIDKEVNIKKYHQYLNICVLSNELKNKNLRTNTKKLISKSIVYPKKIELFKESFLNNLKSLILFYKVLGKDFCNIYIYSEINLPETILKLSVIKITKKEIRNNYFYSKKKNIINFFFNQVNTKKNSNDTITKLILAPLGIDIKNFEGIVKQEITNSEHIVFIETLCKRLNIEYYNDLDSLKLKYELSLFNRLYNEKSKHIEVFDNYIVPLISKESKQKVTGFLYPTIEPFNYITEKEVFLSYNIIKELYGENQLNFLKDTTNMKETLRKLFYFMESNRISDLHINPFNDYNYNITARIDTIIHKIEENFPKTKAEKLIHYLFVMANRDKYSMKKAIRSTISIELKNGEKRNFRLHIMFKDENANSKGYGVSIRRTSMEKEIKNLKDLGYNEKTTKIMKGICKVNKSGLIIITGETNAGKTTLLYSLLEYLNKKLNKKVDTLESPIETYISGINQTDLISFESSEREMSIEEGIKELLSQDSDVTLISESRDKQEMFWTLELALKGHLTFTTFHSSSVRDSIKVLEDQIQNKKDLNGTLKMVINQTLIPKLCQKCKNNPKLCQKCDNCSKTGYNGVLPVYEILALHDLSIYDDINNFNELINNNKAIYISKREILEEYYKQGLIDEVHLKYNVFRDINEIFEI